MTALFLILRKVLMPVASWLSCAYIPGRLPSGVARIALEWRSRRIGLTSFAAEVVIRIASLRSNRHREILQFFPNQTQFVDDLSGYLIVHIGSLHILHSSSGQCFFGQTDGFELPRVSNGLIFPPTALSLADGFVILVPVFQRDESKYLQVIVEREGKLFYIRSNYGARQYGR
jgi:hypothetical protein